ncbi:MAG: CRISPR-associated endonuclease Cas1 [Anaerolineae bacterium]|jgi:CRISPR-associated protein Cas1
MARETELVVTGYGAYISKHQGRLQVRREGEVEADAPLMYLRRVVVGTRAASLSTGAIAACCEHGIPVHLLDGMGRPYAALYSVGLTGTVLTRREQLLAYRDGRSLALAKAWALAKIINQARYVGYLARQRKARDEAVAIALREGALVVASHREEVRAVTGPSADACRERLLSAEGRAAKAYWSALAAVVPPDYGWPGRKHRGATDPINACLNYGYGVLYGSVEQALLLAGLDPYGGYVHADRPGKPSLVFDMIEPYRVPAVDRVVFGRLNRHVTIKMEDDGRLETETRRMVAQWVIDRLNQPVPYRRKKVVLRSVIQHQARRMATYLRGEHAGFRAFHMRF